MADRKPIVENDGEAQALQSADRLDATLTNERLPQKTGIMTGWAVSPATGTTINIDSGKGFVVDNHTDPELPAVVKVQGGPYSGTPVLNVATETFTYFYVDAAGTIQQQNSKPTEEEFRDKIFVAVSYQPLGTVSGVYPYGRVAFEGDHYAYDSLLFFGILNKDNYYGRASAGGTPLRMKVSTGRMAYPNANGFGVSANRKRPHTLIQIAEDPIASWVYGGNDGADGAQVFNSAATEIDTTNRLSNVGGSLTSLATNRNGIAIIYRAVSGQTVVEYTAAEFRPSQQTWEEALIDALTLQPLVLNEGPLNEIYALEYPRNASDLALCEFHRLGQSGIGSGGSGGTGGGSGNSDFAIPVPSPHTIDNNVGGVFVPSQTRNVTEVLVQAVSPTSASGGSFTFELSHGPTIASQTLIGTVTILQGTERGNVVLGSPVSVPANNVYTVNITAIGAFPIGTLTRRKRFYVHTRTSAP